MNTEQRIESLETRRLILRPFVSDDAEQLTALLQDLEIHRWTGSIPYPYSIDDAHEFIEIRAKADEDGSTFGWAITQKNSGELIGSIGLHDVQPEAGRAELGYWLGEPYRGSGYTTEAARRVVSWSFEVLDLYRIQATFLPGNGASASVIRNIGMQEEGLMRGYGLKNGERIDLYIYSVLQIDPTWVATADQLA